MPFAGLDMHKKEIEAVIIGDRGQVLLRQRLATSRETLEKFARRHLQHCQVALEATLTPGLLWPFSSRWSKK